MMEGEERHCGIMEITVGGKVDEVFFDDYESFDCRVDRETGLNREVKSFWGPPTGFMSSSLLRVYLKLCPSVPHRKEWRYLR